MVHPQAAHKKWSRWEDIKRESDGTQSKQLQQLEGMPRTNQTWSKMILGWEPFNGTQRVWFSLRFSLHLLTRQILKFCNKSLHFPKMLKNNPSVNWHLSFQSSFLSLSYQIPSPPDNIRSRSGKFGTWITNMPFMQASPPTPLFGNR